MKAEPSTEIRAWKTSAMDAGKCVVVLVDFQERLIPAIHEGPRVIEEAIRLATASRMLGIRVIGTEQYPNGLGANVAELRKLCDTTVSKNHFDACVEGLLDVLVPDRTGSRPEIVIAGCEAHVCLMQTALGLLRAEYRVWVVGTACGSRSWTDHCLAMERLREAGACIVSAEMVLFEWLKSREHVEFRNVLELVKARLP